MKGHPVTVDHPVVREMPAGQSEWAKRPIDLTRNEITFVVLSSEGFPKIEGNERAVCRRKSDRPTPRHECNGTNSFIWHLIFFFILFDMASAVDVTRTCVYIFPFSASLLGKTKIRTHPVSTSIEWEYTTLCTIVVKQYHSKKGKSYLHDFLSEHGAPLMNCYNWTSPRSSRIN